MRALRYAAAGIVIVPVLLVTTCSYLPDWTLPPILRDLTASGESYCPLPKDWPESAKPRVIAPTEFDKRLAKEFPAGTSEASFVSSLKKLGFEMEGGCEEDKAIKFARFDQHGYGPYLFPLTSFVFWKVDARHRITWVRGNVSYTGL